MCAWWIGLLFYLFMPSKQELSLVQQLDHDNWMVRQAANRAISSSPRVRWYIFILDSDGMTPEQIAYLNNMRNDDSTAIRVTYLWGIEQIANLINDLTPPRGEDQCWNHNGN